MSYQSDCQKLGVCASCGKDQKTKTAYCQSCLAAMGKFLAKFGK